MASRGDEAAGGTRGGTPEKAGSGRGKAANDAVLRALEEVERTVERLKQARAERAEAEARHKAELAQRDARVVEVERRAGELELERAEAIARASEASERCARIESQLEETGERAEGLERRLGELEAELDTERVTREVVEGRLAEAEAARARAEESDRRVQDLEQQLEQVRREESSRREGAHAEAEAEQARLRAELERVGSEGAGRIADLERRLAEFDARAGQAEELARSRAAELTEASSNLAILGGKVEEQRAELERARGEADAARAEVQSIADRLADKSGETDARIVELRTRLEEAEQREAALRADCGAAVEAAGEAETSGKLAAEKFREQIAGLERELASARQLASDLGERAGAGAELGERLAAMETELSASGEALSATRAEFAREQEAMGARLAGAQGEARELAAKLDLAADRLVSLQRTLDERDRALQSMGQGDEVVGQLLSELSLAQAQAEELRLERDAMAGDGSGGAPRAGRDEEFIAARRQRLARARRLIREKVRTVGVHQATLERRLTQCDEVLARRRELVEARQIVERTHQKVVSGRAKSTAAAMVFFGAGLLSVLGVVSWAIVDRMYPATYAASAVVSADFHDTTPKPGEREDWQAFHQQLLMDPQLMSRAAERLAQRGFTELSSPADVKVRLEQDLTWSCPEAGKLALELRGVGREATARALDTYASTLAVEANALRQRRTDTATTVVVEPARPGVEPLVDHRPRQAAIGLAGGAGVSLLLWFGVWRRMVKTKRAFENASQIDHLLEEGRWVDPIQQIIDAHEEGARAA